MTVKHYLLCQAPICADERNYEDTPNWKDDLIWYPGEDVCGKTPFTRWQKRQSKINRMVAAGTFKHPERYFTVNTLLKIGRLTTSAKGGNPNRKSAL